MNTLSSKFHSCAAARRLWLAGLGAALLGAPAAPLARADQPVPIPGVTAMAYRPVYPVLVGNPLNPLLRVTINVGKADPQNLFERNDVVMRSITFDFTGTTNLADIESVTLYSTGQDDDLFRQTWPILRVPQPVRTELGSAAPSWRVTFTPNRLVEDGKNVYWLSCRLAPGAGLLDRIQVACTNVDTAVGDFVPSDIRPPVRQRIGFAVRQYGEDGVCASFVPSVDLANDGTLLCVYGARWDWPAHDLNARTTIGLNRSTDGGRSWGPMQTIVNMGSYGGLPPKLNGADDPGIVVDRRTGRIFVFCNWMHGRPGINCWYGAGSGPGYDVNKTEQFLMVTSDDNGRTWSQPVNLTHLKPEAWWLLTTAPAHGIQLRDGTLVQPIEGRNENGVMFGSIMSSRDHGATWTIGTPAILGCAECAAAELSDGSVMLNLRAQYYPECFRSVMITRDLGRTWEPHATNLNTLIEPKPGCNGSLIRADYTEDGRPKHVLLFCNPHNVGGSFTAREDEMIQVSFDDGMTWPADHRLLLDEGNVGVGYPSLIQLDSKNIAVVYNGGQAVVTYQVIPLADLLHPGRSPQ